jgi:hypothetical protein
MVKDTLYGVGIILHKAFSIFHNETISEPLWAKFSTISRMPTNFFHYPRSKSLQYLRQVCQVFGVVNLTRQPSTAQYVVTKI